MRRLTTGAILAAALVLTALPTAAADADAGVQRISTGSDGTQLPVPASGGTVSADGRYAAFTAADPSGGLDNTRVYVKDLRTGTLTAVPEELQYTRNAMISADGRRVVYDSGNRYSKPYVHDRVTGETRQLWPAQPPDDGFYELGGAKALSADGRHVAYTVGNRHGFQYARVLYVHDLATGTDEPVSPLPPEGAIDGAALDAHGRTVAYTVFLRLDQTSLHRVHALDRDTGERRLIAEGPAGTATGAVHLSADGRRLLHHVRTADGTTQARLHDLRTGRSTPVGPAGATAVAADRTARHVLLARDGALTLLDLRTGREHPVAADGTARAGSVTRHGRSVVFTSTADDLVPDDTNGMPDVFIDHIH
ncbi:hypothetical protein J7F01_24740 [Streptomyces sp. ISL-22]|uniref:hypothetical protein n=1 Tax=unclassified Streptomyces TaxID=2593676 RepID=UPI001BE71970|nr:MULTISPECIES: hypothetical protein [unclassified Streptomyces]MBT2420895.1 hypothetical protein [Streptomyces sp. ISL-24]MBT2435321.1 hypothetical protein [Streptomyces sp. ISL-22]